MAAIALPLPAENVDAWRSFAKELQGPRKEEFDAFNARWGLSRHRAFLQKNPDGYMVIAIHEGPGEARFIPGFPQSDDDFDAWFSDRLSELHGIDFATMPPPQVELALDAKVAKISA